MGHQINTEKIKEVAYALAPLQKRIVFVGGATVSFYPTKPVLEVRPTDDVDLIIEILNYSGRIEIEDKLRALGFFQDIESPVVCRYRIKGIIVDIMPTNDPSIGFTNRWYSEGFDHAVNYAIDEECTVNILSAPYFIATKLEAHKGRGKNDGRTSHDFEDIVFVLENREIIWEEMNNSRDELKYYLKEEFHVILQNPNHFEWIDCHVERGSPPATYFIIEELMKFCS